MIRTTRSRPFLETPRRPASPMHRHAVTPVRRPPKRRRVGRSSLAIAKFAFSHRSSSDDSDISDSAFPDNNNKAAITTNGAHSSPKARARKLLPSRLKTSKLPPALFEDDTASPRKRKRSEEGSVYSKSPNSPESGSWIETEDEMVLDLIGEADEHLLHAAPAHALHRLRKNELVRLWKVAGMWPEDDDMRQDESDLGKAQLVTGIIAARTASSASAVSSSTAFSHKETSESSSTLTSPPSTSDSHSRDVEMTPKADRKRATGLQQRLADPALLRGASTRKERVQKGRGTKPPKRPLKARFGPNIKSPEQRTTRLTRSSTVSSAYSTTDGSVDESVLDIRSTPVVQRLRPRRGTTTSATSKASNNSTEDADAEDNGEELTSPSARRRSASVARRARHQRDAKRTVIKHDDDSSSWEEASSPEPTLVAKGSKGSKASKGCKGLKGSKGSQGSKGSEESKGSKVSNPSPVRRQRSARSGPSRRGSDAMTIDGDHDTNSSRTTRSGKVFGEIRDSPEHDDESMDEDENQSVEEYGSMDISSATLSSLTRLRRDDLVQMCEVRDLEVGGTKPQLARALLEWRDEHDLMERSSTTSSQGTARPMSTPEAKVVKVKAIASNSRRDSQATPILLRTHLHAEGPATPPRSDEDPKAQEHDLNLDLQELGLEDFTIKPEFLVKMDKIGSGGFKDVFVGKLRGRKVAISEFRGHLSEMDIRELKLLAEFRHPNIVRFRGICIPEDSSQVPCMLISELCENGDLYDYIRNVPPPPLKRALRLMHDIAKGLEYLHMRTPSVIHRDCKSTNILITRGGVAKVGDFGLARVKHSTRSMIRSLVGTVNWQAPELWHASPRYDYKVDVFSAALVFWEMLSGWAPTGEKKYPWEGHNEHYIYDAVGQKQKRPSLAGMRKHWGAEPVALIERMWEQDPRERPTMSDVVADLEAMIAECR